MNNMLLGPFLRIKYCNVETPRPEAMLVTTSHKASILHIFSFSLHMPNSKYIICSQIDHSICMVLATLQHNVINTIQSYILSGTNLHTIDRELTYSKLFHSIERSIYVPHNEP